MKRFEKVTERVKGEKTNNVSEIRAIVSALHAKLKSQMRFGDEYENEDRINAELKNVADIVAHRYEELLLDTANALHLDITKTEITNSHLRNYQRQLRVTIDYIIQTENEVGHVVIENTSAEQRRRDYDPINRSFYIPFATLTIKSVQPVYQNRDTDIYGEEELFNVEDIDVIEK